MRDTKDTLSWYARNNTTREIGFNPDGMCLKVCRTARGIAAKYSSAKIAQDATPKAHRVHKVRHLRKGMVLYYDDPRDSNKFGHIVTMVGRVKGYDPDSLHDILVSTNSVKRGELVVVRGDYFEKYWGDQFQFGATWFNGVDLGITNPSTRMRRFHKSGPKYDLHLLDVEAKENEKVRKIRARLQAQFRLLPDNSKLLWVRQCKAGIRDRRVLDLTLLDRTVKAGYTGKVKRIRDEIRRLIDALPEG